MFTPLKFRRPAPAVLLGLGLLGLLLWGQCAALLNGSGGQRTPRVRDFYVGASVDSLGRAARDGSVRLYLKLNLSNYKAQSGRVESAQGEVSFGGQHWAYSATDQVKGIILAKGTSRSKPVAVVLTAVDSLDKLRGALYLGSRSDNSLRHKLRVVYFSGPKLSERQEAVGPEFLPMQTPNFSH